MVYISQAMLQILDTLGRDEFTVKDAEKALDRKELAKTLFDMYVQGLVDLLGRETFRITPQAFRVREAWLSLGRPSADPWVDTRIYTMITSVIEAEGFIPGHWRPILEERGFLEGDELALEAHEFAEALSKMTRRLHVSKPIARLITALPEGPAANTYYKSDLTDSLEAMGLLASSIPLGHFAALTRPGRLLRRALQQLNLNADSPLLLDANIKAMLEKLLSGEKLAASEQALLGKLGYTSSTGAPRPAARMALNAWKLLNHPEETPPFSLSQSELQLLDTITKRWKKAESNPEEAPTPKKLKEELQDRWTGEYYSVTLTLYHLEAMGLVERTIFNKKEVVRLTDHGKRILDASNGRPSSTLAARALVEYDSGRGSTEEWVEKGRDEGLLGIGGPTRYGRALAQAAREGEKSVFLTGLEALILKRLPSGRAVERGRIIASFKRYSGDVEKALEKLETRGLVKTTGVGFLVATPIGEKVKTTVIGVDTGIAVPIHPVLIKVLKAVSQTGLDDPAELINTLKLDIDTVKTALILARRAGFLGKTGLTESGKTLLEVVEDMARVSAAEKGE